MNQARIAGLGNLLVDEALWRAGIDPARTAATLTEDDRRRLHRAIRSTAAVRDPTRRLAHRRPRARSSTFRVPKDGAPLQRRTVGGTHDVLVPGAPDLTRTTVSAHSQRPRGRVHRWRWYTVGHERRRGRDPARPRRPSPPARSNRDVEPDPAPDPALGSRPPRRRPTCRGRGPRCASRPGLRSSWLAVAPARRRLRARPCHREPDDGDAVSIQAPAVEGPRGHPAATLQRRVSAASTPRVSSTRRRCRTVLRTSAPEAAADAGGLEAGDVITEIDGTEVATRQACASRSAAHDPGDEVTITYTRDGDAERDHCRAQATATVDADSYANNVRPIRGKRLARTTDHAPDCVAYATSSHTVVVVT